MFATADNIDSIFVISTSHPMGLVCSKEKKLLAIEQCVCIARNGSQCGINYLTS